MADKTSSFLILDSTDSTNNYAMALIHSGKAVDGFACFAYEQTNGKGRRGKVWETRKGENIIISIIVNASFLSMHEQFHLSASAALSCHDFFNFYSQDNVKIKWPNDIYINDRKAGGILIENIIKGNLWQWAVIGIGLNINQNFFSNNDDKRISLGKITGKTYDVIDLSKQLHTCVLDRIEKLKSNGFDEMLTEYNEALYKINDRVKLKKQNIAFETTIKGVSRQGELITFDSMEKKYKVNEITFEL